MQLFIRHPLLPPCINLLKKYVSLRYFDTCFMHNIGGVSDRRWHDILSMQYIDKASCNRPSKIPPILCIKHVSK